jgi:hypothetical protein
MSKTLKVSRPFHGKGVKEKVAKVAADWRAESDGPRFSRKKIILAVVLGTSLYCLSAGPVGMVLKSFAPSKWTVSAYRAFYYPIVLLYDHTPLRKPIRTYLQLWDAL